jgi:hypothetical protein
MPEDKLKALSGMRPRSPIRQSIALPQGFTHGFVAQATQKTFVGMEPQPCCHMSNFRQVRHRGFSQ